MFSQLPSHKVRQLVFGRPSDRVYPASLPHDGLTSAWGSEIRTASGLPDERSPRVFHIPDAQHRDCSLAFAVLRGRRCTSSSDQPVGIGCSASSGVRYQRREPEKTLLHRIVREHLATFLVEAQDRYPQR